MACKHNDCANFACFDVARGYCLKNDGLVPYDGDICMNFHPKAKCRNCVHFSHPDADGIGTCDGLSDGPYWTPGDNLAQNCEGYARP